MPTPTPDEPPSGGTQAASERLLGDDGYVELAAVFNTEAGNADRRAARDIYARRCEP